MAKTLTQRIADRVAKEGKGATKKNRAIFLALRGEVEDAIKDGWPVKTIWETLHDEGRVTFSYQAFRLYVNKLIDQGEKNRQVKQAGQVLADTAITPAALQLKEPVIPQPVALPGFEYNTKPQTKDLI